MELRLQSLFFCRISSLLSGNKAFPLYGVNSNVMEMRARYWFLILLLSMGMLLLLLMRYNRASEPMKRVRIQHPDTTVAFRIQALHEQSSVFGLRLEISGNMLAQDSLIFFEDDGT